MALQTILGENIDELKVWNRGEKLWQVGFVHVYSIMIAVGVLASFLAIIYYWRRQKYSWENLQIMLIIIVPTSILGARFWYVVWEGGWDHFFTFEGLSIQGGVFFSTVAASIYAIFRRRSIDYKTAFGMILPNVILGQMLGRWGNFANHEVYGGVVAGSQLDWLGALKEHMLIRDGTGIAYRQPFFFYEFLSSGIGWIIMVPICMSKNWFRPGVLGAAYLVWYGVTRLSMESFRDEGDIMGRALGFDVSSVIAGTMVVSGVWLFVYWQWLCQPLRKYWKNKYNTLLANKPAKPTKVWAMKRDLYKAYTIIFNTKDYIQITPIRPVRKYLLWGEKRDTMWKVRSFYGIMYLALVPNHVPVWIPRPDDKPWTKRELKRGKRQVGTENSAKSSATTEPSKG